MFLSRWSKLRSLIDMNQDGQIGLIDISLWVLAFVFSSLSLLLLALGGVECYLACYFHDNLETLIKFVVPLTQIFGTFGSLVYSVAFMFSMNCPCQNNGFFDFDRDGKIGLVDLLCTFTGIIHTILIALNGLLWYLGYFSPSDVVDFVVANTRVIILILTKSYLAIQRDPSKYSAWAFFVDVNHDGVLELVDLLACIFNTSYFTAVTYAFTILMISPLGQVDLNAFIQFTCQINFVLISAFASVYLSNQTISTSRRRILEIAALLFLLLLGRTVVEILRSDDLFKAVARLLNGLVLGVTQLFLGIFMMQTQAEARNSTKSKRN
jgi:hypothetical protein